MALLVVAAFTIALVVPAGAAALTGRLVLNFEQFPDHTEISSQYEPLGILFGDQNGQYGNPEGFYPEIRYDDVSSTNPVLGGTFGFGSKITAQFVKPGTTEPIAVEDLAMDVGYIDDPGSTILTVERTTGPYGLTADEYGFNHLELPLGGIIGFSVQNFEPEDEGWEIDNVEYTIPTPAPPPPPAPAPTPAPAPVAAPSCPKYLIVDSRGSGEKQGIFSPPAEEFDIAFENATGLDGQHAIETKANPYPAVAVFGWYPEDIANGIQAFIHKGQVGAYHQSVLEGERDLKDIVHAEVSGGCGSQTKIILLGYSQGAEVAGDVYEGLAPAEAVHVAAVVLFGDPLYNHRDKNSDQGSRNLDGALGTRPQFAPPKSTEVLSYCNEKDPICQWRLPLATLLEKRLSEHKKYWGDNSLPAFRAAQSVAKFVAGKR